MRITKPSSVVYRILSSVLVWAEISVTSFLSFMILLFPSFVVAYKFDSLLMSNHVFVRHLDLCGALVHVGPLEDLIQLQPNQINGGHQSRIQFSIINFE